ncbi:MAG: lysophospholipid acyltransferase family protein [Candidatus Eisenbacteria bacterium]
MRPLYRGVRATADAFLKVLLERETSGLDRVPRTGGIIVAANHISFWDPPVIGASFPRELAYATRADFFGVPGFAPLIRALGAFPMRRGTIDLAGFRQAERALARGDALLLFPEGGRMKDGDLHPALPGLGQIAAHTRVPIVPLYVSGTNHIRRCMVRRAKVRLTVGAPLLADLWFPPGSQSTLAGRALYQAISDRVMQEITLLRAQQEETTRSGAAPATITSQRVRSHERGGST